jgi:hypothetical protein
VVVYPVSWVVYETEDANPCGLYRFLPHQPGKLSEGGRLQMLAIKGRPGYDTRYDQQVGRPLLAEWVDIPDPDPADAESNGLSVSQQGYVRGGASFTRLEGCWVSGRTLFFNSTSGGQGHLGYTFAIWGPWEAGALWPLWRSVMALQEVLALLCSPQESLVERSRGMGSLAVPLHTVLHHLQFTPLLHIRHTQAVLFPPEPISTGAQA